MKRSVLIAALLFSSVIFSGCTKEDYWVHFKVLRQNTQPAEGFKVDLWVKGKSEPKTFVTDAQGMAEAKGLPFPSAQNQLCAILHYYKGKNDDAREITYPYINSDRLSLKDTQYIPNNVTPDPS